MRKGRAEGEEEGRSGEELEGNRIVGVRGGKDIARKNKETTNLAHRNLKRLKQQPGSLHRTDLGSPHIGNSGVVWSIYRTPNNEKRG